MVSLAAHTPAHHRIRPIDSVQAKFALTADRNGPYISRTSPDSPGLESCSPLYDAAQRSDKPVDIGICDRKA